MITKCEQQHTKKSLEKMHDKTNCMNSKKRNVNKFATLYATNSCSGQILTDNKLWEDKKM